MIKLHSCPLFSLFNKVFLLWLNKDTILTKVFYDISTPIHEHFKKNIKKNKPGCLMDFQNLWDEKPFFFFWPYMELVGKILGIWPNGPLNDIHYKYDRRNWYQWYANFKFLGDPPWPSGYDAWFPCIRLHGLSLCWIPKSMLAWLLYKLAALWRTV